MARREVTTRAALLMSAISGKADSYRGGVIFIDGFHITRKQLMAICEQAIGDNPVHPPGKWAPARVDAFNREPSPSAPKRRARNLLDVFNDIGSSLAKDGGINADATLQIIRDGRGKRRARK